MARSFYGGTPADFVIAQGADAHIVNETGTATGDQGSAVLLPLAATAFTAYLDAGLSTSSTDLLDEAGTPITTVSQETAFDTRGTIPRFQGPDGHEGPLWLSADGVNGYRLEPESGPLYGRVGAVESDVAGLTTSDLDDVSATLPTDGQILVWNNSLGVYEPGAASGTGTVTSVAGVSPDGSGDVDLSASDVGAPTTSQLSALSALVSVLQQAGYVYVPWTGSGYEAKPPGFAKAIRIGPTAPTSQNEDGDLYFQPEES